MEYKITDHLWVLTDEEVNKLIGPSLIPYTKMYKEALESYIPYTKMYKEALELYIAKNHRDEIINEIIKLYNDVLFGGE